MAGCRFPSHTISYAFTIPALVSNLVILGVLGFLTSVSSDYCGQDLLMDILGFSLMGAATIYLTVVSWLTHAGIAVPLLAAVLLDSLVLIPFYLTMILYIASTTDVWLNETDSIFLGCEGSSSVVVLNIVILALQSLTLVLTVIDLIRVIRIHRAAKREAKEPHSTATGASVAEATDLVAEMRTMKSQLERLVEAQQRALERNSAAGPSDGFDNTLHHSFSTMKREQSEALRETRPTATNLVLHTDNGVELMAGPTGEQGPPEYSSNAGPDIVYGTEIRH